MHDLNPEKSSGPDGWHPILLKYTSDLINFPLSVLLQKSLNEGMVSPKWLEACITVIHKKGKKNIFENYRPVSITSIICKVMESIIRDKIINQMERNNIFADKQHGFVPLRNCMTNLLTCMESWTDLIEKGQSIDIIYTDFANAFDNVPHQRLLRKMKDIGIVGNVLNWVRSFLTGRNQRVRVENEFSNSVPVKSGIPQGSVLGPTLFVIFINDMPEIVVSMCQLFADDAKIFRNVSSREDCIKLQNDLDKLTEWSARWQLPFNVEKCKSLHRGKNNSRHRYVMDIQELEQVREEKDLGVLVDDELKFHRQTAAAVKKANVVLGMFDEVTLPLLYKSLVRPHLEYGKVIWGPFYKGDIKAVERIQRRATKLVPQIRNLSYEERLKKLSLSSLTHRRRRGDMITTNW